MRKDEDGGLLIDANSVRCAGVSTCREARGGIAADMRKGGIMSGVEWTVVTVIGVCLIVLFVILEAFFPASDTSDRTALDRVGRGGMADHRADHQSAIHPTGFHTLQ